MLSTLPGYVPMKLYLIYLISIPFVLISWTHIHSTDYKQRVQYNNLQLQQMIEDTR